MAEPEGILIVPPVSGEADAYPAAAPPPPAAEDKRASAKIPAGWSPPRRPGQPLSMSLGGGGGAAWDGALSQIIISNYS